MFLKGVEVLMRGGWVMVPLLLCALVSVAVMIERSVVLRRAARYDDGLVGRVRDRLAAGDPAGALAECERTPGAAARVVAAGVRSGLRGGEALDRVLQEAALKELPPLNRRLGTLDTIITLSPLLGLLGTITGMIASFQGVATATGASAAPAITGGVAEALIATATGLAVAIVTLPVYNHLTETVKEVGTTMERRATELQNALTALPDPEASRANGAAVSSTSGVREGSAAPHAPTPAA